tara:strand:+ start:31550 stop:32533 length:984 start_codon:yes stop_codon:yes gene_type:complete
MSLSLSGPIRDKKNIPEKPTAEDIYNGIDGDVNYQFAPELNKPPFGEETIEGPYGSGIRVGVDRINERTAPDGSSFQYGNGYGGIGAIGCSMVDIYAGLNSWSVAKGKVPDTPVNPSAQKDAARVYVSAMCDVDDQFDFPDGTIGNIKGKSAAVVKADQVRIDGREGVKITTGIDLKNSKKRDIRSVPAINLIAGNVGKDKMHPIPKGNNLLKALDDIVDNINELSDIVDNFLMFQHKFNSVIMSHTHPSPTGIGIGMLAGGGPTAFCNGSTLLSYDCATGGFDAAVNGMMCKKDLMMHKMTMSGLKASRMERYSGDFINSRQVFTS